MTVLGRSAEQSKNFVFEAVEKYSANPSTQVTCAYLAEELGVHYHTVRRHLVTLMEESKIERYNIPSMRDTMYRLPDSSTTPKISFDGRNKDKVSIDHIAFSMAQMENIPTSLAGMVTTFPHVLGLLYQQAGRIRQGADVTPGELRDLKAALGVLKERCERFAMISDELMKTRKLWSIHELPELLLDDPNSTMDMNRAIATGIAIKAAVSGWKIPDITEQ